MSNEKLYFKNLDAIRFIAALMVFLTHVITPINEYLPIKNTFWQTLVNTVTNGGTGVSVFFVLSGFLITYLLISEHELTGTISVKKFYIRRVLRIWPLYFFVVAFAFFIYPFLKTILGINNPLGSNVWYHLTFLSNFDVINIDKFCKGSDAMSQNITWSVSIEEQFYLFWPLIFAFLPRRLWIWSISLVITGSILFRLVHHSDNIVLYFHTFSVLLDLGIGALTALLIQFHPAVRRLFERTNTGTHITLFISAFVLLLCSDQIALLQYGAAISRVVISTLFALIIASQAITKQSSVFNLSNLSFASRWGKYTYGIYLIHPMALLFTDIAVRLLHIPKTNLVNLVLIAIAAFILTLLMSKLSYRYFESRFLAIKDQFTTIVTHE